MKKIDVFDEENSIVIDDKYDVTTFEVFPEAKKITVSSSKKEDCFYNYLTYTPS